MNLLWAPGMSEPAKEVCRNLSSREKAAIYTLSFLFGVCVSAVPIVFMGAVASMGPAHRLPDGFALPLILCLSVGAWSALTLQRRLLAGSQFARDNGITWEEIFTRHPMTRGDLRILVGIAALTVMITLAFGLAAFMIAA